MHFEAAQLHKEAMQPPEPKQPAKVPAGVAWKFQIRRGRKRKRPKPTSRASVKTVQSLKCLLMYSVKASWLRSIRPNRCIMAVLPPVLSQTLCLKRSTWPRDASIRQNLNFVRTPRQPIVSEYGNNAQALPRPRKMIPIDRGQRREQIRQALYNAQNK